MSHYKIVNDGFDFQELDLEIDDLLEHFPENISTDEAYNFSQSNLSLKDFWPSFQTGFSTIDGEKNLMPDISYWIGATLVTSPKAHRFLAELLSQYGELLPFTVKGEGYYIFNCLNSVSATPSPTNLDEPDFGGHLELSVSEIFKPAAPFLPRIYCNERFCEAVKSFGLSGIDFIEL